MLEISILAADHSGCEVLLKMGYEFPSIRAIPASGMRLGAGRTVQKQEFRSSTKPTLAAVSCRRELQLGRYAADDALRIIAWADEMPITEPFRHMADEQTPLFQFRRQRIQQR